MDENHPPVHLPESEGFGPPELLLARGHDHEGFAAGSSLWQVLLDLLKLIVPGLLPGLLLGLGEEGVVFQVRTPGGGLGRLPVVLLVLGEEGLSA